MNETTAPESAGWRMNVAIFALCAAIFTVLWLTVAAFGTRFGWWGYETGLLTMTGQIGAPIALLSTVTGLIAQVIAMLKFPRKNAFIVALAATLIAALAAGRIIAIGAQAGAVPPIHDVQTDWADPVAFSEAMLRARAEDGAENDASQIAPIMDDDRLPETFKGRLVSEVQEEAEATEAGKGTVLPAMQSLYFAQAPNEIAELAVDLVDRRGWTLVTEPGTASDLGTELQVEATAVSGWFGFKDDVAIRIRPVEGATRVDMRSISRVGLSDLGANSKRVSGFMNELQDRGDGRTAP